MKLASSSIPSEARSRWQNQIRLQRGSGLLSAACALRSLGAPVVATLSVADSRDVLRGVLQGSGLNQQLLNFPQPAEISGGVGL